MLYCRKIILIAIICFSTSLFGEGLNFHRSNTQQQALLNSDCTALITQIGVARRSPIDTLFHSVVTSARLTPKSHLLETAIDLAYRTHPTDPIQRAIFVREFLFKMKEGVLVDRAVPIHINSGKVNVHQNGQPSQLTAQIISRQDLRHSSTHFINGNLENSKHWNLPNHTRIILIMLPGGGVISSHGGSLALTANFITKMNQKKKMILIQKISSINFEEN